MEEQWDLDAAVAGSLHRSALSRQNFSDVARDLGGLDTLDGDHLFITARAAISGVQPGAFVLGLAAHLHDESLCRQNRGRRADRLGCDENERPQFDLPLIKNCNASRTPAPCWRWAT